MTVIEVRTMEIICHNLPKIAKQLKRIADEMFFANQFAMNKACEAPSQISIDGKVWNVATKEVENG